MKLLRELYKFIIGVLKKTKTRTKEDDNEPIDYPLVWINDVCRITVAEHKLSVSPVGALFYVMEQLTVQNLGKRDIYLFVDITNETNKSTLNVKRCK